MRTPWHENYITVENARLRILDANRDGQTCLVLWCGLGATAEQFTPLISKLKSVHIVAIDPPGHGFSESWNGDFDETSVQNIWEAVLDEFNVPNIYIGGHSYGAYTALMGSLIHDRQIKGVVLLDGGYMGPFTQEPEEVQKHCQGFITENIYDDWEQTIQAARREVHTWSTEIEYVYRAMMKEHDGKIVPRVDVPSSVKALTLVNRFSPTQLDISTIPVMLFRATEPEEINEMRASACDALATRLVNLKIIDVPDSGHDVLGDNPSFVVNHLMAFMGF